MMRRSAAGAGKIPGESMPSGQAPGLHANRATVVRGYVLRREDLREFRSAYNRVAVSRSTPLRRIVASPRARPPPWCVGRLRSPGARAALDRRASAPLDPPSCPAAGKVAPSAAASLTACQGGLLAGQGSAICCADGPRCVLLHLKAKEPPNNFRSPVDRPFHYRFRQKVPLQAVAYSHPRPPSPHAERRRSLPADVCANLASDPPFSAHASRRSMPRGRSAARSAEGRTTFQAEAPALMPGPWPEVGSESRAYAL
jgi:hypothetical protein